jgi:Peptidase family M23
MILRSRQLALVIGLLWSSLHLVTHDRAGATELTPLLADVLSPPRPVLGSDGQRHLVYELMIGNVTGSAAEIRLLEVIDRSSGEVLLALDQSQVAKRLSLGGRRGAETSQLGVAQFGVAFMHVALGPSDSRPGGLTHRITAFLAQPGRDVVMEVAAVQVLQLPTPVLAPPLAGAGYVVGDGCCDTIRHVRALLTLGGRFTLAQRFAIDWEQIDASGRLFTGDPKLNTSYHVYGEEVLAVADGTIVASRNDLPDQTPGALPPGLPLEEADGNFVVQDIGGSFVLYAHMQPGSVRVSAGDRIRRGEIIGKVGNTGNSQAPHLHLHVTDGPSPLTSNGVPYVFEEFTATAVDHAGTADFDTAEATGSPLTLTPLSPPQVHKAVLPLDLWVVNFPR